MSLSPCPRGFAVLIGGVVLTALVLLARGEPAVAQQYPGDVAGDVPTLEEEQALAAGRG